jgi:hypothetical protein
MPDDDSKYIRLKVVEWTTGPNPTPEQVELFRLESLDDAGYFQPAYRLLGDVVSEPNVPDAPENHCVRPNGRLLQWRMPATVSGFFNLRRSDRNGRSQ